MKDPFADLEALRTPREFMPRVVTPKALPKPGRGEFIAGPIPLNWMKKACRLGVTNLAVGLVLWFRAGCKKDRTISVSYVEFNRWGLVERRVRRALRQLEAFGLIKATRHRGRSPVVTLLDAPDAPATCQSTGETPSRRKPQSTSTKAG